MQETRVQSLGQEDPLEKGMAIHPSILAEKNPMDRVAWQATVHGVTKNQTWLSMHMHTGKGEISWKYLQEFLLPAEVTL